MAAPAVRFSDLIEMIDRLPLDERESLIEVVRRRNADDNRRRIAASARAARKEHARGKTRVVSPEELVREILG